MGLNLAPSAFLPLYMFREYYKAFALLPKKRIKASVHLCTNLRYVYMVLGDVSLAP